MTSNARSVLDTARVIPVVSFDAIDDVLPLADALLAGDLRWVEVTLRTPVGLPAIERLVSARPELVVGAGTVWSPTAYAAACEAGAAFVVSPGTNDALFAHAPRAAVPWLPAGQTVTELGRIHEAGYDLAKFFPAEAMGGIDAVTMFADVLPDLMLCPTGGLNADIAARYLALANVFCVAGSWVAPRALIRARDWGAVTARARVVAKLGSVH